MVMDLVEGGELFDAVAEQGKLSENDARMYFQQLVEGISHCHLRRVYHRDIKPENLLLSQDKKTLKITDFGLSSIKGANSTTELWHTTMGSVSTQAASNHIMDTKYSRTILSSVLSSD